MDKIMTSVLSSIGLSVILFVGIWLLIAVALNEMEDTLNRIFAAIGSSILIFVFCYVIFIVITK